ncbi:hypothetical protein PAXRUDRAFT_133176 [Paxillus rubicundulus Ve08.2h10]|uniref:Protoporphyrinogen oxidase n=1 Tax=Paxillus rubicundulus Ve08.2h10 TaxID=930991 RepID=A0A0D0EC79_9AGAM|nr:hypothetical protein PAXRUDRAFT_133176 [Paxillus rubicundulus Ve08.2h10]
MVPESIAVLGGGLTGLSAAFHLSRRFPAACITVINKDTRFGGWVRSERVKFAFTGQSGNQEEAEVLLEAGPRTLRPDARSVLELIHLLNLSSSLITVPKSSAAAKNRFLHIPGSEGIHRIPSSLLDIVTSLKPSNAHLGRILVSSAVKELLKRGNRPPGAEDESVDEFLSRRFGNEFARVFGSALVHGIYAADSRKLSLRSAFPSLWNTEDRGRGSIVAGLLRAPSSVGDLSYDLGELQDKMRDVSVYSFKDGIGTLVNALVKYLREQPNVHMCGGVRIMGLRLNPRNKRLEVTTSSQETLSSRYVVSALPLHQLRGVLSPAIPIPHLTANAYSSVTVVSLVFPSPSSSPALHPDGFGYLVPRGVDGYSAAKGSGILGCVFDSSSTAAQDICHSGRGFTKMTVMLGGPYVSPTSCASFSSAPPSPQVDVPTLISELSYQLNQPLPSPILVKVFSNTRCIPLYSVGHLQRMDDLKRVLASEPWNGRLEVVGAGVGGVSVGDCVEAGRNVGRSWS